MAKKKAFPRSAELDVLPVWSRLVSWPEGQSVSRLAVVIFLWGLAVHAASLVVSPLAKSPVGLFFFGDSVHFFEQARRLAAGEVLLNSGLPFHPPLVPHLLMPLWWLLSHPPAVHLAGKLLMAVLAAGSYAMFFRLLSPRLPHAFWICLLMPLSFGELALTSALSSELPYRVLLLTLLALGWRWPFLAGGLHGLAALARAEHLGLAFLLALVVGWRRERRRWLLTALGGFALVLGPQVLSAKQVLSAYNRDHAAQLPSPLPEWVPVSFYGPLNFALAQREEEIFFARESLPPAPGGSAGLEPTFAPHHDLIVHGYAVGWAAIREQPGRFLTRTFAKARHSLAAFSFGWTWRDTPKPGRWTRYPVDVAAATSWLWSLVSWCLLGLGVWHLREDRQLLALSALLLAYRLGVNLVFFPYLRGLLILSPLVIAFQLTGLASLFGRRGRGLMCLLVVIVAVLHFATLAQSGTGYRLSGERRGDGSLIDDRPVVIERVSQPSGSS